ncbi:MAG: preprotein translocase subunit SecA, partial [Candidatus Cloacimonetes bacterium]|nr:preprotein translocase subunit SecA [Candidatus Cloacimonadota bacterium]
MFKFLNKFLDSNQKELARLQKIVDEINALEPKIKKLTNERLREKTEEFKKQLTGKSLGLSGSQDFSPSVLPPAFAVAREAIRRVVGERAYDVQLMAAIALHEGKIAEQKTGEGKTLSAAIAMYLNALTGRGVHLVTV